MNWLKEMFGVSKPIIAMCHMLALPGDPGFDVAGGIGRVIERARIDLEALQEGGVDGVMFSNEASLPYLTRVEPITYVTMARIIGELHSGIKVPFGVNVLWDPKASVDVAMATGAQFVREIFTGIYASDFGLWNTNCGEVVRHQHAIHAEHIKLLFNIVPESAVYLGHRDVAEVARSTVFNTRPHALCVSGLTAGVASSIEILRRIKNAVPDTPVLANTGVRSDNLSEQLEVSDGAVTGTAFKREGIIWNEVDIGRVREFMQIARKCR
ncbi:MAG TPA: BtpA/SgcQ family protein [Terriglobia bacterium]|nr:BtpA/SgcQ family protein [Terriglobia bacterium]